MLKLFIKHEMMSLIKSNRVIWSMLLFLVLFSIFFSIRVEDFQKRMNVYIQDVEQTNKELKNATNYSFLNPRAIRKPQLFSIYHEGMTHYFGTVVDIRFFEEIIYAIDLNGQSNLFFTDITQLDITYLITFFLSLFILLISYDCINREKMNGTLRIVMTWPFKRNLYLLKKLIGVTSFVFVVFSVPYLLSLIFLIIKYGSLLNAGFIFSYLVYWFMVVLYILLMSGIGVLISIITKNPGKSLVLALFVWVFFCIISPLIWNFTVNFIPTQQSDQIQKNLYAVSEKKSQFFNNVPDSLNVNMAGHWMWSGGFINSYSTFCQSSSMKMHRQFNRYLVNNYMPIILKREELYSNLGLDNKRINNLKPYFMFFNPNILLESAATEIGGSAISDYHQFIGDAKEVRNKLMDQGIREGWLFTNEFFASYDPKIEGDDIYKLGGNPENMNSWEEFFSFINNHVKSFEMKVPEMARYQQREITLGEILQRSFAIILIFIFLIILIMYCLKICFNKYDIR